MLKSHPNNQIGNSVEEFSKFISDFKRKKDAERQSVLSRPIKLDPDADPAQLQVQVDLDLPKKVPDALSYLFGRYPMDEPFAVTTCNSCERIVASTYMERHVEECAKIPQVVKDELHLQIYGKKFRTGANRRISSGGDKPPTLVSRLAKQSSPSPELRLSQPAKSGRSSTVSSRTCSSAPSSPTSSSLNASNTQALDKGPPLAPLNYSFPTIKIEKSDSPSSSKAPLSPSVPPDALKVKKEKTLMPPLTPPPSTMKIQPSVVLKIKGNTSTTTTVPGRVPLDSILATESPTPSPSAAPTGGDVNPTFTSSPKPEQVAPVLVKVEPQTNRVVQETPAPLPNVVITLGQLPKVELKSPSSTETVTQSQSKKKGSRHEARKIIPLRERCFNPDEHCGVFDPDGTQCKRSLTCKTHSMALRRAVPGRSHPFDSLISTQKQARHKARLAKQTATSPASPGIGMSAVVASSVSNSDGSSDASRVSLVTAVTSPPASVPAPVAALPQNRSLSAPLPCSTVTLKKLLNSGIQYGDTSVPSPTLVQLNNSIVASSSASNIVVPAVALAVAPPPKKKVKKFKLPGDTAIKLQMVPREPEGFDCVTHIVPPEDEGVKSPETPQLIESPFKNGKNVLFVDNFAGKLVFEPFSRMAIPVGRRDRDKEKWIPWGSPKQLYLSADDYFPANKKLRRDEPIEGVVLFPADQLRSYVQKATVETQTLTPSKLEQSRNIEGSGSHQLPPAPPKSTSDVPSLQKIPFRLHAKKPCRPHHARNGSSYLDVTKHVGPLVEVTHSLNGVALANTGRPNEFSATSSLANFDSVEMASIEGPGDLVHAQLGQPQMSPKSYEENGGTWLVEPPSNILVDEPVGDSELGKLLSAQFGED